MKSAAVGNPQGASQGQTIDAPISVMFPALKRTLNRAKSTRPEFEVLVSKRRMDGCCNLLGKLFRCLILLLLGNRERERVGCLLKSYSERIQSLDFPRTLGDATSLSAESGSEVEELSRARERDPRECPQTPEKLSISPACPLGVLLAATAENPREGKFWNFVSLDNWQGRGSSSRLSLSLGSMRERSAWENVGFAQNSSLRQIGER